MTSPIPFLRTLTTGFLLLLLHGPDDDKGGKGGKGGKGKEDDGGDDDKGGNDDRRFTQAELDAAIARRVSRIERKYEGYDEKLNRLADLEAQEEDRARKANEEKGNYDRALKSAEDKHVEREKTWKKREDTLLGEIRTERVTNRLIVAATGKAINAAQVAKLLRDEVRLNDEMQPEVIDTDGKPRFKAGRPMTPEELVDEFLGTEKHLKLPSGTLPATAGDGGADKSDRGGTKELDPDLDKLEADYKEAVEKAKMGDAMAVTKAHALKRKLEAARKAKKSAA